MADEWENRYARRTEIPQQLKKELQIRIFGPYAGYCSYILDSVAERLSKEGYSADICLNSSEIEPVANMESGDVYNLQSSLDCIDQADACAFVFMSDNHWKFFDYGPFYPRLPPQGLNSSVVVEFERWKNGVANPETGFVIYEGQINEQLGSLVRGVAKTGSINSKSIDTNSYNDAITQITDAIAGRGRIWVDLLEDRLYQRLDR